MEGSIEDPEHRGVIPRSVHFIFDLIEQKKYDCTVRVSYLELYNEELNDLLSDEPPPAQVFKRMKLKEAKELKRALSRVSRGISESSKEQIKENRGFSCPRGDERLINDA